MPRVRSLKKKIIIITTWTLENINTVKKKKYLLFSLHRGGEGKPEEWKRMNRKRVKRLGKIGQ